MAGTITIKSLFSQNILSSPRLNTHIRYLLIHLVCALLLTFSLFTDTVLCTFFSVSSLLFILKLPHKQSFLSQFLSYTLLYFTFLWTSSYWLLYCLFDFLHLSLVPSSLLLSVGFFLTALILSLPAYCYHFLAKRIHYAYSLSFFLVLFDFFRMHTFFAMPWLFYGNHAFSFSIFQSLLPISGFFISTYLFLRLIEIIVNLLLTRYDKDARFLIPGFLLFFLILSTSYGIHYFYSPPRYTPNPTELFVNLLQPNHSHLKKREPYLDWEDYLHMIHPSPKNSLNVTAEGAISFSSHEIPLSTFKQYQFLKNTIVGINFIVNDQFTPMLIGTNDAHGSYRKYHLVPFGEYFPLPSFAMSLFGYYNSHRLAESKPVSHSLISYNGFSFFPLICYDLFFPLTQSGSLRDSDAIIAIAENTWYRNSVFQSMFYRAAKIRALESKRPVLLVLNRGPSVHINAGGSIVKKAPFDEKYILKTSVSKIPAGMLSQSFALSPTFSLFLIFLFETISMLFARYLHRGNT